MKLLLAIALLVLVFVPIQWEMSVSGSDSVQCKKEERLALLHINASMTLTFHSLDGKWEGNECCRWERVTCDPITGHITQLDLGIYDGDYDDEFDYVHGGISLNATLFLPIRHLRSLSLYAHGINNCTDDAGFESWSNLTKLQMLDLSANFLPRSIISSLARVSSLRALYLDDNFYMIPYEYLREGDINGAVQELGALNLEVLSLNRCGFNGSFPYVGHWPSLKALSLAGNDLSGNLTSTGVEAQFSTFDNSSYEGNPNLCGLPLSKSCVSTLNTTQPTPNEMRGTNFLILFGSFSFFFVVNFWCFMIILYFKRSWRYTLFTLVDHFGDMIYVKVVLLTKKIGASHTQRGS